MDPVVQAAGTALVQAIVADTWQQVKVAVTGLCIKFAREKPTR